MWLKDKKNDKPRKAKVSQLLANDHKQIKESGQYKFNWEVEEASGYDLYKIYILDETDTILGLISLEDIKTELRIHINLIEISIQNVGKGKAYDRIAGSLIAFAVQLSFDKSYDGFVSLVPKTKLIDRYCSKYGFQQYGRQLALGHKAAVNLLKTYL